MRGVNRFMFTTQNLRDSDRQMTKRMMLSIDHIPVMNDIFFFRTKGFQFSLP